MIRNQRDFYAGLLFMAFGIAALVMAASYPLGTAARMGPGYFPRFLGILLVALGAAQSVIGLRGKPAEKLDWHWRPLLILLLSVAFFILIAPRLGMVVAGLVLAFVSSFASAEFRWREALVTGLLLGGGAAALFIYGLGVPLPIWPVIFTGG